jgi:hypothetical protein
LFGPLNHLSAEHFPDEAVEREVTAWLRQQQLVKKMGQIPQYTGQIMLRNKSIFQVS